jgi:hypothetical protein
MGDMIAQATGWKTGIRFLAGARMSHLLDSFHVGSGGQPYPVKGINEGERGRDSSGPLISI